MAKLFFFAALLAAIVGVSVAQGEGAQRFRDVQCRREVQQIPLDACRQVMDQQLSGGMGFSPFWSRSSRPRTQCCQQLQDVSLQCRCAAIRQMVRDYEQTLAPLEGGHRGMTTEQQQGYYGQTAEQQGQGEGYYGQGQEQEGGYYGEHQQQGGRSCGEGQEQEGGYYGGHQQQGGGYYGEGQQQQGGYYGGQQEGRGYYGGQQEGRGYYGGQQQEGGYYGETAQQQAGGRCSQTTEWQQSGGQQQGQGYYGEQQKQRRVYIGFPPLAGTEQQTTRVRLTKVRQYAQQLPATCRIEPQDCSVFAAGQY